MPVLVFNRSVFYCGKNTIFHNFAVDFVIYCLVSKLDLHNYTNCNYNLFVRNKFSAVFQTVN